MPTFSNFLIERQLSETNIQLEQILHKINSCVLKKEHLDQESMHEIIREMHQINEDARSWSDFSAGAYGLAGDLGGAVRKAGSWVSSQFNKHAQLNRIANAGKKMESIKSSLLAALDSNQTQDLKKIVLDLWTQIEQKLEAAKAIINNPTAAGTTPQPTQTPPETQTRPERSFIPPYASPTRPASTITPPDTFLPS